MVHGVRCYLPPIHKAGLIPLLLEGTLKSSSREGSVTAKDIARDRGCHMLLPILEPLIHHDIPAHDLNRLETYVHELMIQLAGTWVSAPPTNFSLTYIH